MVIQLLIYGFKNTLDISKILNPAKFLVHLASDAQFYLERMTVQPGAFMLCGKISQPVRCFDTKFLINFHQNSRKP